MPRVIHFSIQDKSFAMDMSIVYAIESPNKLPHRIAELSSGQPLEINGQATHFLDLNSLVEDTPDAQWQGDQRLILTDDGHRKLACLVDKVGGVVEVHDNQVAPLPPVCDRLSSLSFPKVLRHPDGLILMVDPVGACKVLAPTEADLAEASSIEAEQDPVAETDIEFQDGPVLTAHEPVATEGVAAVAERSIPEQEDAFDELSSLSARLPDSKIGDAEPDNMETDSASSDVTEDDLLDVDGHDALTPAEPWLTSEPAMPAVESPQTKTDSKLDALIHGIDKTLSGDKLDTMVTRVVGRLVKKKVSQSLMQAIADA